WRLSPRLLAPVFEAGPLLLGHNLAFDLRFLERASLPVPSGERLFDTMLAAQLLGASAHKGERPSYRLDAVVARLLGVELPKELQTSDWSGTLSDEQSAYAARDATVLLPLHERLTHELTAAGLIRVTNLEMRA